MVLGQRQLDLSRSARAVKQDRWMVYQALTSTQFLVAMTDPEGAIPFVTPALAADYTDCEIEFISGVLAGMEPTGTGSLVVDVLPPPGGVADVQFGVPAPGGRVSSMIRSLTSVVVGGVIATTITLYDPLPANPKLDDQFIIYRRQSSAADLRENGYSVQNIDLTILRNPYTLLGVAGRSCTLLAMGGAAWQIGFKQGNAVVGSLISSSLLFVGSMFQFDFQDIAIANAAAPGGTAQPTLYVGQRV